MHADFPTPEAARFPLMVVVAVTNACNYRCTHCFHPTYLSQPGFRRHDMEPVVFHQIADELGQHPQATLRLIAWGEPMLHRGLVEFVRYARGVAPHNKITLITNGYRLAPKRAGALMEAGLDLVEISLDAAHPATYARIRATSDPEASAVVEDNVRTMVGLRNRCGYRTRIAVSFVTWPTPASEAEFARFHGKWCDTVDAVLKRPLHTFKGTNAAIRPLPQERPPCYGLWARCNINPWGQISVCYNDWENRYLLGDLREPEVTIAGIWRGPLLDRLRAEQCQRVFSGCCKDCRDYNPQAWQHPYEEVIERCCPDG